MSEVFAGIEAALSFGSLIANVTGVSLGILFGAMPGLTAAMGVALLIPLSFGMPPVEAFSMLLGMYAGAIYGGSITAILVGTPGTVAAAATLLEGPKLTARGNRARRWKWPRSPRFRGHSFSAVALVTCAPLLATAAMSFGPAEYFALAVFALTVVATLSSGAMCKGLAAAFVGLFLSTVGIDPVSGDFRNTFDVPELFNGISLVPALVGLFAVSQVLLSLEDVFLGKSGIVKEGKLSNQGLTLREIWTKQVQPAAFLAPRHAHRHHPGYGGQRRDFHRLRRSQALLEASRSVRQGDAGRRGRDGKFQQRRDRRGAHPPDDAGRPRRRAHRHPARRADDPRPDARPAAFSGARRHGQRHLRELLRLQHPHPCGRLIAVRILGKVVLVPTAILMSIVLTLCAIGSFAANNSTFDIGEWPPSGCLAT